MNVNTADAAVEFVSMIAGPFMWRFLSKTTAEVIRKNMSSNLSSVSEVKIPVPWGHIAGKEWGSPEGEPWIALHGWLDNCGSFDNLLPFFPSTKHRIIAIDLPGHGLSSHIPNGFSYHYLDGLQFIRRVALYYELDRFSLLGHSMGAGMSMMYTVTHPDHVKRLVMLDAIKPISRSVDTVVSRTRASIDDLLSIESKLASGRANYYTYETALKRLLEGSNQIHGQESITVDSAKILLKRGLKRVKGEDEDAWDFTRDLKHRITSLYGYPQEVIKAVASEIKCPFLIVKAHDGRLYESEENASEVLDIYKATNPQFRFVEVQGNHHVHLNEPQNVWPAIDEFLQHYGH